MASWVDVPQSCDFSLANLPYGVFSRNEPINNISSELRIGTAIGEHVLDLKGLAREGLLAQLEFDATTLEAQTLNHYAAQGRGVHRRVRSFLQELLKAETPLASQLRDHADRRKRLLIPLADVTMHLPMAIGGYTDFFVGIYHSENCARIFRPGQPANPNYTNLPVAYTGRASSVMVSGTSFRRPYGQYVSGGLPTFAPSQKVDFEVEFGAFIAQGNAFGEPIDVQDAEDHIFGYVLLNDWSARDVQRWESQPLGPFNGKSFCTTISPWVVTPDALEPYKAEPVKTGTDVLSYLAEKNQQTVYNIPIDAAIISRGQRYRVARCNTRNVIFSFTQMVAHHTANGCPLQTGDLIGTGTLSGPTKEELGCLLEATEDGKTPIEAYATTSASETPQPSIRRQYLEDGDEVEFRVSDDAFHGVSGGDIYGRVGFGLCSGKLLAARRKN